MRTERVRPEILIGFDYYWDTVKESSETNNSNGWYEISTTLGKVRYGKRKVVCHCNFLFLLSLEGNPETKKILKILINADDFWKLEAIGVKDSSIEKDDGKVLERFYSTLRRREDRCYVNWLFYLRLKSTLKRLKEKRSHSKSRSDLERPRRKTNHRKSLSKKWFFSCSSLAPPPSSDSIKKHYKN